MRYFALACDYDGTLAQHGRVDIPTLDALKRLRANGRELVLVSGRELEDLQSTFDHLEMFGWAVLENGALLYRPGTREEKVLAERPPENFLESLRRRGVSPISVGRTIVATWRPQEQAVLDAIHECGLELQIIFNKDAVMVLPAGVNKATGLAAALLQLGLSPHNVVGVGDAENDHAFLGLCECGVAVDNALPALKETADFTTRGDHGAGVTELINELIDNDLAGREPLLARHHLLLGHRADGTQVRIRPYGNSLLFAGPSGSGKSTAATSFLERLIEARYQFCLIDPEGDFASFGDAVVLGGPTRGPTVEEVVQLLTNPAENAVINLVGMAISERPPFFLSLLPRLQEMRARVGRPHWLIVDEAHHMFPASWERGELALAQGLDRTVLITVHSGQVNAAILTTIDTVVAVGKSPYQTLGEFCQVIGVAAPAAGPDELEENQVLLWSRHTEEPPFPIQVVPHRTERIRHVRKYAEGQLPPERSFWFRGPKGNLNLRAQNLILFLQLADGVDDETWLYHLREGDYSRWFRDCIKDEDLAGEAERVEQLTGITPRQSRDLIRAATEKRYTLPAAPAMPMPGTDAEAGAGKKE
jgi:HAD superfamily hydrolase (TIGR01484 family)